MIINDETRPLHRVSLQKILILTTILANIAIVAVWLREESHLKLLKFPWTTDEPEDPRDLLLGSDCVNQSVCEYKEVPTGRLTKSSECFCDEKCHIYDDCCTDLRDATTQNATCNSPFPELLYTCKSIDDKFGDIQMVASCPKDWFNESLGLWPQMIQTIESRCVQMVASNLSDESAMAAIQVDPMGMIMPITDQLTNVTYANSYCLRCNREEQRRIARQNKIPTKRPKLISWSPMLKFHAGTKKQDQDAVTNLVRKSLGYALEFSSRLKRWLLKSEAISEIMSDSTAYSFYRKSDSESAESGESSGMSRSVGITPWPPKSVIKGLRFCRADIIRKCDRYARYSKDQRKECETGARSLVFSRSQPDKVFYNFACAVCNGLNENQTSCHEPKTKEFSKELTSITSRSGLNREGEIPQEEPRIMEVLFDVSGDSNKNNSVNIVQCYGLHQVYDPFLMTCRCLVCGVNNRYRDGRCVEMNPANSSDAKMQISDTPKPDNSTNSTSRPIQTAVDVASNITTLSSNVTIKST